MSKDDLHEARRRYRTKRYAQTIASRTPLTPMFLEREVIRLDMTRLRERLERLGLWGKV